MYEREERTWLLCATPDGSQIEVTVRVSASDTVIGPAACPDTCVRPTPMAFRCRTFSSGAALADAIDREQLATFFREPDRGDRECVPPARTGTHPDIVLRFDPGFAQDLLAQSG